MLKHVYLRIIKAKKIIDTKNIIEYKKYNEIKKYKKEIINEIDILYENEDNKKLNENKNDLIKYNYNNISYLKKNDKIFNIENNELIDIKNNENSIENNKNNIEKNENDLENNINNIKFLNIVLKYSSEQIIKNLKLPCEYINNKEFYMSLSLICNQLAINKYEEKTFWNILSNKLIILLQLKNIHENLSIRWLSLILHSFAKVQFFKKKLLKECSNVLLNYKNEDYHCYDITQVLNSYYKLNYMDFTLFKFLSEKIYKRIDQLNTQCISNICNAYSKLTSEFESLYFTLSNEIKKQINKFNEQEIANILNSYSKLNTIQYDLFYKFLPYINKKIFYFKTIEITMLANAFAKCNIYEKRFFSHLSLYIQKKSNMFNPIEFSILANSYAKFNLREMKIFYIIKTNIINKETMLDSKNIAMLLHAFGKLLIRDENFIRNLIIKNEHKIDSLDSRNLTMFYVSIIKLNIEIPLKILNKLKKNILKNLNNFTDLAIVSICYSSMFYKYFDIYLISSLLILLDKRKANSKSFCHQIKVALFVISFLYDLNIFSYYFIYTLYNLLNRVYIYSIKNNYYDIRKSFIQKRIFFYLNNVYKQIKHDISISTEVSIGPFVVDILILDEIKHKKFLNVHKSIK